jgi:hypothetical protein
VGLLRGEAADRFLRWREVERVVGEIKSAGKRKRDLEQETTMKGWSKAKWEMEWMEDHSLHVARRMREGTITQRAVTKAQSRSKLSDQDGDSPNMHDPDEKKSIQPSSSISFDPLHLPSLFFLSLSLFDPLKSRVKQCVTGFWGDWNWKLSTMQMAIIGGVGFCFGLGVGLFSQ